MKLLYLILFTLFFTAEYAIAQNDSDSSAILKGNIAPDSTVKYLIIKHDKSKYTGYILSKDAREIKLRSDEVGLLYIPMHEIAEIKTLGRNEREINNVLFSDRYSNRMFFSSTALKMGRGEGEMIWSYFSIEGRFGIGDRTDLSIITSYLAVPIIVRTKYQFETHSDNFHLAGGLTVGTLSWASPTYFGIAPGLTATIGNLNSNFSLGLGLGIVHANGDLEGAGILNIGSNSSLGRKASFAVESNIIVLQDYVFALITPGIRVKMKNESAFQFGFMAGMLDGELNPIPIPNIQYIQPL